MDKQVDMVQIFGISFQSSPCRFTLYKLSITKNYVISSILSNQIKSCYCTHLFTGRSFTLIGFIRRLLTKVKLHTMEALLTIVLYFGNGWVMLKVP